MGYLKQTNNFEVDKELLNKIEEGDRFSLNKLLVNHSCDPKTLVINAHQETLLHLACRKGHFDLVRALVEIYNCTLKVVDKFGNSPFHTACAHQHLKIVQYFSCYITTLPCAQINADGDTVLHVACKTGSVLLVRVIIHDMFLSHKFIQPLKLDMYQDNVLEHEFFANDFEMLNSRFEIAELMNYFGFTPIHTACYYGHLSLLQFFFSEIKRCLTVTLLMEIVPSLLSIASEQGHFEIIDYLHSFCEDGINTYIYPVVRGLPFGRESLNNYYEKSIDLYGNVSRSDPNKIDMHGKYSNRFGTTRSSPLETVLFFAARHADKALFKHLTQKEMVHIQVNCSGDTLLHAACASCDIEIVQMAYIYLTTTLDIDCIDKKNNDGNTCLHIACEWGASYETIQYLIEKGFSIDVKNRKEQTPIHLAILYERYAIFDYLLSHPIDINAVTVDNETPLHLATSDANLYPFVEKILAHPNFESINFRDIHDETPIFNACRSGDQKILSLLTDYEDCNLLAINKYKETIFNIVCRMKLIDTLTFLFTKITSYPSKLQNYLGQTLLHVACCTDSLDMVRALANHGTIYSMSEDINLMDKIYELTPLQYASTRNNVLMLKFLLEVTDCDPDTRNKTGDTVLHISCERNFVKIAMVCKEYCSITVCNEHGETPLHVACRKKNFELALILLKDVRAQNIYDCYNMKGDSVLHVAATRSNAVRVLKYMIEEKICDHQVKNAFTGNTALHNSCLHNELDSATYLFQLDYDECSWYNCKGESPLSLAFGNHSSLVLSIISSNLVKPWQYQKCVKMESPLQSFEFQVQDCVEMPFPHFVIQTALHGSVRRIPQLHHGATPPQPVMRGGHFIHHAREPTLNWQASSYEEMNRPSSLGSYYHSDHEHRFSDIICNQFCKKAEEVLLQLITSSPSVLAFVDSQRCNVLHYLAVSRCPLLDKITTHIIKSSIIDIKLVNSAFNSPLHLACHCKNEFMIYLLLQHKNGHELLHGKNRHGQTPLDIVHRQSDRYPLENYLTSWGADNVSSSSYVQHNEHGPPLVKKPSISIIVLGNSTVGKTTLIHTLKAMLTDNRNVELVCKPTTGIITDEIKSFKNDHRYTFYDFAGQIEFETSHSLRLESLLSLAAESSEASPFVFLLVVKAIDSCTNNKKQIDRWFSFIRRHVKITNSNIHMALVCSHDDHFENDLLRQNRRVELKKYIKLLDIGKMRLNVYEIPIFLNGLKSDTVALNRLLRYLEDMFLSSRQVSFTLSLACQELSSLLDLWFHLPCQVKDIIEKIKECRYFSLECRKIVVKGINPDITVPHEPNKVIQLLKQLHVQNYIILLMQSESPLEWWIINKSIQNIIFSKVVSIFSPCEFEDAPNLLPITHNTGVIPTQKLCEVFHDLQIDINLLQSYLTCMEFCFPIEDEEVLNLIIGDETAESREKCFFFPGLIRQDKRKVSLKKVAPAYRCVWVLENHRDLGLRFLHTLLLRLTFKFVANKCQSNSKYDRRLFIWKNGMFWHTISGIDVLIEIVNECKVIALFQCTSEKCFLLAKLRSDVLSEIRKVQHRYSLYDDGLQKAEEFFIYPPPSDYNDYESLLSTEGRFSNRISVNNLVSCFCEEPESRSLYISDTETASLQEILGFDSYIYLKKSTLNLFHNNDIKCVKKAFHDLRSKNLEEILESDYSHEEWVEEKGEKSVLDLTAQLLKYSYFTFDDLCSML